MAMQDYIEERCLAIGGYITETGSTVRQAAEKFGLSKSSVHKDMAERLPHISQALAAQVRRVLDLNKAERHLRGGKATYLKYKGGQAESLERPCAL
jgi:putative DeoR family transcriptional regulator (stage III sporulation protein D)